MPRFLRPAARLVGPAVIGLALAGAGACETVELTAPTGSTITLYASPATVAPGGSSEILASVVRSGGTPVQDGTSVVFTTSLGSLEPTQAETQDGRATVRFLAGSATGTARIAAFSGGITATEIEITVQ